MQREPQRPQLARVASRSARYVAISALGLFCVYLAVANAILMGHWLRQWVSNDDIQLGYAHAYTLWPGSVEVQDLTLRIEDTNVQVLLRFDEVQVDVVLHQLLSKEFHADRVRTSGTAFRLRMKVDEVGDVGSRIVAGPPIDGLAALPIRSGGAPATSTGALWGVRLENVTAELKELWVLEYHFVGRGKATGGFQLQPGERFSLEPSRLELSSGSLSVDGLPVATQVNGSVQTEIQEMDIKNTEGLAFFRKVDASVDLRLEGGDLSAADVYVEPMHLAGSTRIQAKVRMKAGRLQQGSEVVFRAQDAMVETPMGTLMGDARAQVSCCPEDERLTLWIRAKELVGVGQRGPTLRGLVATLETNSRDVGKPVSVERRHIAVKELRVPDLSWFAPVLGDHTTLAGQASAQIDWTEQQGEAPAGQVDLKVSNGSLSTGDVELELDTTVHAHFTKSESGAAALEGVEVHIDDARLTLDGESSGEWYATARSNSLRVLRSPAALQGTFDIRVEDMKPLLPLVAPDLPAEIGAHVLGLEQLEARVAVYVGGGLKRVEVLHAKGDPLQLRGHWQHGQNQSRGTFLLETGAVSFGLQLRGGELDVVPGATEELLR